MNQPIFIFLYSAFTHQTSVRLDTSLNSKVNNEIGRRCAIAGALASIGLVGATNTAFAVDDDLTRGGVQLTPFNGLAFQYKGSGNNGLDASTLNEPSIPYAEFLARMDKGEVEFVEFLAPNGDAAYVTFKPKEGEAKEAPIRIGEGYPIEDPEGWSSPAFVVKSVKKKGVAYKVSSYNLFGSTIFHFKIIMNLS